jgi:flagellar L-ring protein precursor FlgH
MTRTTIVAAAGLLCFRTPGAVQAQSLFERPAPAPVAGTATDVTAPLQGISLFVVVPPAPRAFEKNDLVEIIVNESSLQKHEQTLDAEKDYRISALVAEFPSLQHLFEGQLENGDSTRGAALDLQGRHKFKGDGEYERKDRFTARITATVLEVKPNGTLLLEARKSVKSNDEESEIVLSGVCRPDDISANNTIQSSQLANLTLSVQNAGDVKRAGTKGLIPRVLETIFNF